MNLGVRHSGVRPLSVEKHSEYSVKNVMSSALPAWPSGHRLVFMFLVKEYLLIGLKGLFLIGRNQPARRSLSGDLSSLN